MKNARIWNTGLSAVAILLTAGGCASTGLRDAASRGEIDRVRSLLSIGADVNAAKADGVTPLYSASLHGHTAVVTLLLERGANLDATTTPDGFTALWAASAQGHLEVVGLLLAHQANVGVRARGFTPLWMAAREGHAEVA